MIRRKSLSGPAPENVKRILPYIVAGILAASIGIYLRLYPLLTHIPFDSSEKATIYVLSNIRKSVIENIEKNYPDLPVAQKNELIKRSIDNILKTQGKNLQKAITTVSTQVGTTPSELTSGPYLQESDGYYYYSLTENIATKGKMSGPVKGSKYFNDLMLHPEGFWQPLNLHPYVGYNIYRLLKFFFPDIDLMFAVSFTPLFLSTTALVLFIVLCYQLQYRPLPTCVGAILLMCATIFLKRSMFAWYDDDGYNVVFPLLIILCTLTGLKHHHHARSRTLWGMFTALSFTFYALFWHGWMFLLTTLCAGGLLALLYARFIRKQKKEALSLLKFFSWVLLGTLGGITVMFGPADFFVLFQEGWKALNDFLNQKLALWPDLYIGVGELEKPRLNYLIDLLGGYVCFFSAIFGFLYSGIKLFRKHDTIAMERYFVLGAVFLGTLYLSYGAIRFALLAVIPTAIFCVIGLSIIFEKTEAFFNEHLKEKSFAKAFNLTLILCMSTAIAAVAVTSAYQKSPLLLNKIFNSAWERSLLKIRKETPQESVVNTWWPPGHFIKAIAQRRVLFDGSTINKPQGYWLANLFINSDERQAIGTLRMLNNSANAATEYLQENGMPLSQAVELLKMIVGVNEAQARQILSPILMQEKISHLLQLTHATPPPTYILLYNDLIEKSVEMKFVGGWNFKKAEELSRDQNVLKNLPPKNSIAYIQFLWNIAGGAYRFSGILGQLSQADTIVTFEQNTKVDLRSKQCFVDSPKFGKGIPKSIFYLQDGKFTEKKLDNSTLGFSVLLSQADRLYECILLDRPLALSFLMRMYFLEGAGLKYVKLFTKEEDLTRRTRIYVYEVDWEKFAADLNEGQ